MYRARATVGGALLFFVLALGVTASGASAAKLTLSESGVALAPGVEVFAEEEAHIEVNTPDGRIECPASSRELEVFFTVLTNSARADELAVTHLSDRLFGPCRSFTGNAQVQLRSLGSVIKVKADGTAVAGLNPTVALQFEHAADGEKRYEDVECIYRRERLHGTSTATLSREALQIELVGTMPLRETFVDEGLEVSKTIARHLCPLEAEVHIRFPSIVGELGANVEEQTST